MLLIVVLCFSLSLSLTYTHTHTHTKEASQNVKPVSGNSKRSMGITGTFETKRTWSWLLLWESKRGQAKEKRAESEGASGKGPPAQAPLGLGARCSVSVWPAEHCGPLSS